MTGMSSTPAKRSHAPDLRLSTPLFSQQAGGAASALAEASGEQVALNAATFAGEAFPAARRPRMMSQPRINAPDGFHLDGTDPSPVAQAIVLGLASAP
jgi:hypothetical protein